ncbi:MAG: SRPBCC family protein [Caulobacterales bacterium]
MIEILDQPARLTRGHGYTEARFNRRFEHPPAEIWRALTDPAFLPQWLAPGDIALRLGGPARLDFGDSGIVIDSVVTAFNPGRLLEYSWSGPGEPPRPVRWVLTPLEDGCQLTLTLRLPDGDVVARSCAGWEAHLEMLAALLEGVPIKFPFETFKASRAAYEAQAAALAT